MMISGRERLIIVVAAVVVALLGLDRYVITPLLDYRDTLEAQKQGLLGQMDRATALLAHKREIGPKWREMTAGGLKRDPTEAEIQILHVVQDWAREAGLKLASMKPERLPEKRSLQEISFQGVGTGSMNAVARFLWRVETAKVPVRVKELQLGARKEGTDDLTLQVRLSTVYQPAQRPGTQDGRLDRPSWVPVEENAPAKAAGETE
jgi:Tfp pilus assembly protein PilO